MWKQSMRISPVSMRWQQEKENGYGVKEETGHRYEGYDAPGDGDPGLCDPVD